MPTRSDKVAAPDYFKILEEGPFAGIRFPYYSAKANALYIFRELLHSFLITHPHLDHLSALGVNTPALELGREAKAIVALPPTIEAIKNHIFNDSIWPNLSDENHGVGFVTYRRLTEGGNLRFGSGDARGYVSVCDGLATKCLAVTHGKCARRNHSMSHQRGDSSAWFGNEYQFPPRRMSRMSDDHNGFFAAMAQQQGYNGGMHVPNQMQIPPGPMTPGIGGSGSVVGDKDFQNEPVTSSAFFIRNDVTGKEILIFGDIEPDSVSMAPRTHLVWDEAAPKITNGTLKAIFIECSYDDSVRDSDLFGHLCPRHLIAELESLAKRVMAQRERKNEIQPRNSILSPILTGINLREPPTQADMIRKRKRDLNGDSTGLGEAEASPRQRATDPPLFHSLNQYVGTKSTPSSNRRASREAALSNLSPVQRPITPSKIPRHVQFQGSPRMHHAFSQSLSDPDALAEPHGVPLLDGSSSQASNTGAPQSLPPVAEDQPLEPLPEPLKGVSVHIIHVKDTMVDGQQPGEVIAKELKAYNDPLKLGCTFDVTDCAESIWV